ncbi:hypothetical protein [Micromonospora sagamiensis]|nr:hypothetical protein [Micromonospora sagamiensis]BCL15112.1 hypothetical protein GCM10017556_28510 [Micromonospora sagamiensis]
MRARHPRRWTACLVALALLGTGTACGADPERPGRATAERDPVDPEARKADEAAAGKAALAAYAGYLNASRAASARSDPHHPDLAKYLADPLLTRVRLAIREAKEHGAMRTGKLVSDPTVTVVSLDTVPAAVEIQDCLDATGYKLVYAKTRKVVPGTGAGRHLATATATRYPDGRWLISAGVAHEDQPC